MNSSKPVITQIILIKISGSQKKKNTKKLFNKLIKPVLGILVLEIVGKLSEFDYKQILV